MKQGDRAWHYSHGPKGAVRRVAIVVGLHDSEDRERVNLTVFPTSKFDADGPLSFDAIPVRYDYKEGGPVDVPFCTPMDMQMIVAEFSPEVTADIKNAKDGEFVAVPHIPRGPLVGNKTRVAKPAPTR